MKHPMHFLFVLFGFVDAGNPLPTAVSPHPDLRPDQAVARIKSRNLFHPARGIPRPESQQEGNDSKSRLPCLKGTLLGRGDRAALLQWPGASEQVRMEEGAVFEGIRLLKVESLRIQIQPEAGGDPAWVELQQEPSKDSGSAPPSDLEALLHNPGNLPGSKALKKGKP